MAGQPYCTTLAFNVHYHLPPLLPLTAVKIKAAPLGLFFSRGERIRGDTAAACGLGSFSRGATDLLATLFQPHTPAYVCVRCAYH